MNGYIWSQLNVVIMENVVAIFLSVLIISVLEKLIPHYQMRMIGGNNINFEK